MKMPTIALTSLKIQNFRGIESLDLDFRGPDGLPNQLVVLGGPNGAGKTTVLEAAFLAIGGRKDLVGGPMGRKAIKRGAADFRVEIETRAADSAGDTASEYVLGFDSKYGPKSPHSPDLFEYFSSWRAPSLIGAVDPTVGKRGRRPADTDRNRLLNVKQRLVNAAAIERFSGGSVSPSYGEIQSAMKQAWHTFYPGRGQSFEVEIVSGEEADDKSFDVFLNSPTDRLSVDLLSAGQLELFLFIGALALVRDRDGVVFIDEPELHLDPQWHRAIVRTLLALRPSAQFILATHSPEIYAEAKSYERHFLVPADDPRSKAWVGAVPRRNGA